MFEEFSRGYYLGRMYVEPHGEHGAAVHTDDYEAASRELYSDGDLPLVMKLGRVHLAVTGDDEVPSGTLAVEDDVLEDAGVRSPPTLKEVLVAKEGYARHLLRFIRGADGGSDDVA